MSDKNRMSADDDPRRDIDKLADDEAHPADLDSDQLGNRHSAEAGDAQTSDAQTSEAQTSDAETEEAKTGEGKASEAKPDEAVDENAPSPDVTHTLPPSNPSVAGIDIPAEPEPTSIAAETRTTDPTTARAAAANDSPVGQAAGTAAANDSPVGQTAGTAAADDGTIGATQATAVAPEGPVGPTPGTGEPGTHGIDAGRGTMATRTGPRGIGYVAEHEADDWWRSWLGRTTVVLGGVLVLGTALIWAWLGGLTNPVAHDIPVAVISGDVTSNGVLAALRQQTPAIKAVAYANAKDADNALTKRRVEAILASDATLPGGGLNLTIASAAGPGVAETVTTAIGAAANALTIPLTIEDIHPLSERDPRGLTAFYLVLGWVLGGLLAAIVLGIALGTVPRDLDRLGMRLAALAIFSLALGLLGALFAGPILGVWHKHTIGLWLSGALITMTVALIASALQSWLGLWGVALAVVLFLVLGVPGSGGSVAWELTPGFFRGMRRWIPNGLGTDLVRGVEYFGRSANTWPITGLTLWALASVVALVASTAVLGQRARNAAGFGTGAGREHVGPTGLEPAQSL